MPKRVMLLVALIVGCDKSAWEPNAETRRSIIVSNPVLATAARASGVAATVRAGGGVVYVSLPPQAMPFGTRATIVNRASGQRAVAPILNGGFDPVGVPAAEGEALDITIERAGEQSLVIAALALARRRPVVVRTDPPPRRRDVPLNARIVVVFSEPIDPTTLGGGLQLVSNGESVPGTIAADYPSATAFVFEPAASLTSNSDYRLVISDRVRDLDGEPLEMPVTVDFATGPNLSDGQPAAVRDSGRILIDASRDGGVWWYPQWAQEGGFDPNLPHQGRRLAEYLRGLGYQVTELPRPFTITPQLLDTFGIVIRAGVFGGYEAGEVAAYQEYVRAGGRLFLIADHMKFATRPADSVANSFGLPFEGITRGNNLMEPIGDHPITSGVDSLGYGVGSALRAFPDSAQILGRLVADGYLDLNNNEAQDPGEPSGPAVFGVMRYGAGRIVFSGDLNMWELLPQPLVDNVLAWLRGT